MPKRKSKLATELLKFKYWGMKMLVFVHFVSDFSMGDDGKANIKLANTRDGNSYRQEVALLANCWGQRDAASSPAGVLHPHPEFTV